MYKLHVEREISASHQLKYHEGKCSNLHGHNYKVIVELTASGLIPSGSSQGMVMDFGDVKGVIDSLDHTDLNKKLEGISVEGVRLSEQPTAELIAKYIHYKLTELAEDKETKVGQIRVIVYEAKGQYVEYTNY